MTIQIITFKKENLYFIGRLFLLDCFVIISFLYAQVCIGNEETGIAGFSSLENKGCTHLYFLNRDKPFEIVTVKHPLFLLRSPSSG